MLQLSEIQERLTRKGCFPVGSGMYGTVYVSTDPTKVIKVGRELDAWPEYIHWAAWNGYLGTYAPMVYSFKVHNGVYTALCERLERLPHVEGMYKMVDAIWHGTLSGSCGVFSKALRSFMEEREIGSDLSTNNVMQRNGELVVTDPAFYNGSHAGRDSATWQRIVRPLQNLAKVRKSLPVRAERPATIEALLHEVRA